MRRGTFRDRTRPADDSGWVAERFKAPVLKTGVGEYPTVGSNPTPSASGASLVPSASLRQGW